MPEGVLQFTPGCGSGCVPPEPPCVRHFDEFTRTAAGPGAEYEELADAWPTTGTRLDPPATGMLRLIEAVPTDADGYRWESIWNFGGANGTVRFLVDWVEQPGPDWTSYHYLEFTATTAAAATIQLFKMNSGTPTALKEPVPVPLFNRSEDCVVSVCINTVTTEISATVLTLDGGLAETGDDDLVLHTGGVSADRYVGWETIGVGSSARIDDAELSQIGGADDCANCGVLEDCAACENSDPTDKTLPNLIAKLTGLIDLFQETSPPCAAGLDGVTYDCPALDGNYIVPFVGCSLEGAEADQFDCAGTHYHSAANYSIAPAKTISGQPIATCEVPGVGGTTISVGVGVSLVKLVAGGYEIWGTISTGTGIALARETSYWKASFDGDCLEWSGGDVTLGYQFTCDLTGGGTRTCDHSAMTFKVGRP